MGGGGGSTTKKIMPPGKTLDVLCLFCSFSKHVQNGRFCAEFGQKCVFKKRTKKIMIFAFFDLFCSFLFAPDLVDKLSSNREQKNFMRHWQSSISIRCVIRPFLASQDLIVDMIFEWLEFFVEVQTEKRKSTTKKSKNKKYRGLNI